MATKHRANGPKGSRETSDSPENAAGEPPQQTFDATLAELQGVVEQLENADLPLEQALHAFERGVALSRRGQEILDKAERKVELLLRDGTTESFGDSNDRP